jgi:aspartyl-tRNA(Asn)/glutamyl-tRNA(Gln) amidotransferase subunit B
MTAASHASVPGIARVRPIIGMEIHVELRTRTKMFTAAPSPAHPDFHGADPNTLTDALVLALPGTLPVPNRAAIELSMRVGLALGCRIAERTKWDRKSYFYPDLPKAYQISQYDLPVCFDGAVDLPGATADGEIDPEGQGSRIGIIRAHLEEDAGKLLHEAPGGGAIDFSIVDLNRAGTPLLEIVTAPDFTSAGQAVLFARQLRRLCRAVGATEGVMQKGHMRFEPNINCELTLEDGRLVRTPIVEVKNLNSFRAVKAAIEHELAEQPKRWLSDKREMGPGAKSTRGWDDARGVTVLQREKEDAHDYRYFPDPDIRVVAIGREWVEAVRSGLPELPLARQRRYEKDFGLSTREAEALTEERGDCDLLDGAVDASVEAGMARTDAGRAVAKMLLQTGARLANERGTTIGALGISPAQVASIVAMRADGTLGSNNADALFEKLCDPAFAGKDAAAVAEFEGLLIRRDPAKLAAWCDAAIAAHPQAAADVRAGKMQAIGRLVGEVMKQAAGAADAKEVREALLAKLSG